MSQTNQPPAVVVVGGSQTNTDESSVRPENDATRERELELARQYGELTAEYRRLQNEVIELRAKVESGQASTTDLEALRSELVGLRAEMAAISQPAQPAGAVVEVVPEGEPIEEKEPPPPKMSWLEILLRV